MSEEKNIKQLENSSVQLTLTLPASKIEEDYKKSLDKYAKNAQISGFRKGHVPTSILESKFGPSLRAESTFDTMEAYLKEQLETLDAKDKPLQFSTPVLQDEEKLMPFKPNSDITFSVVYDVMPVFDLPQYTGMSLEVPTVKVSDQDVTKELDKLREENSMVVEKKDAAANGDIVNVDYVELDDEGKAKAGTENKDFTFTVGTGYNYYEFDSDLVGMKAGDEKSFDKSYPADCKTSDLAGKTVHLKVTMKTVKIKDVPALDDDFAQDVKEEYKTVADLTKATREKLEADLAAKMDDLKYNEIADAIAKSANIALPKSMVDFELDRDWNNYVRQTQLQEEQLLKFLSIQHKTKEDLLESWRPEAEKMLKVQLVMDKIKEKENFTVSKEDLDKQCDEQLKDVTNESQKAYYRTMIEDDMKFNQVASFLQKNNTFKEGKEISYEDFLNGKTGAEEETKEEEAKA